ncbi:CHAP domain-containing protein [Novosphingobium album (ex Liu et al. 2023)]|uniref:CHAP domain-containing protein n=1 Tax=Novosphingobium album (ex Liu et al. 2023) TaxID=3031130 RepID=UPI003D167314
MLIGLLAAAGAQAQARSSSIDTDSAEGGSDERRASGGGYLQCVPYARQISGIQIRGDAHTWWGQAAGRYARGSKPRVGAVMALEPHGNSRLGHVAAVSRIVDARTILISHANWSNRGQIERNVTAIDVSPANDWSEVRVWYAPIRNLGGSHWPVAGFIYNEKPGKGGDKVNRPALAKAQKQARAKDRKKDPIGAIIAGNY